MKGLALPKFIRPPVASLANGKTKQLVPLDAQCNDLPRFPDGTTFRTETPTSANGSSIASLNSSGLLTAQSKGLVFAIVTLPNGNTLLSCKSNNQPGTIFLVQVAPMTIYLRFLADTITYMKASFPSSGLQLTDAEVLQVKDMAVAKVQKLFDIDVNVPVTNVSVRHTEPPGFNQPDANQDGVVVIDIVALKNADGTFQSTRRWSTTGAVVTGEAPINDLNWLGGALFGIDALGPDNGVFINKLPLIDDTSTPPLLKKASIEQIAKGIGNVAAHEAGHALGMVPNTFSTTRKSDYRDERFSAVTFDGDSNNHASQSNSNLMAPKFDGKINNVPVVLTDTAKFRGAATDTGYLKAILPR